MAVAAVDYSRCGAAVLFCDGHAGVQLADMSVADANIVMAEKCMVRRVGLEYPGAPLEHR